MKNSIQSLTDSKSCAGSKWLKLVSNAFSVGVLSLSVSLSSATAVFADQQLTAHPFALDKVETGEGGAVNQTLDERHKDNQVIAKKVNINSANFEQLITLPGIGKVKAAAIMDYRQTVGPFNSIADIQNIKGIGEKLYAKLNTLIEI